MAVFFAKESNNWVPREQIEMIGFRPLPIFFAASWWSDCRFHLHKKVDIPLPTPGFVSIGNQSSAVRWKRNYSSLKLLESASPWSRRISCGHQERQAILVLFHFNLSSDLQCCEPGNQNEGKKTPHQKEDDYSELSNADRKCWFPNLDFFEINVENSQISVGFSQNRWLHNFWKYQSSAFGSQRIGQLFQDFSFGLAFLTDSKISADEFQLFVVFSLSFVNLYLSNAVKSQTPAVLFQIAVNSSQS